MYRTSPETLAERGRAGEMKDWDKVIAGLWSLVQFILIPLTAGLDARFGWTSVVAGGVHLLSALGFAVGLGLFSWAMVSNAYFSTVVRIQTERGHSVFTGGPYAYVRHPGYVGAILQALAMPALLGSWWALGRPSRPQP
jgi:protein-S-isoprenylcysteine O-methyltransferase Ste14